MIMVYMNYIKLNITHPPPPIDCYWVGLVPQYVQEAYGNLDFPDSPILFN